MKSFFKKLVSASIFSVALIFSAAAVPGMVQYIPDFSGEYVYYSDRSFTRTSIVGFLYYNDSTYAYTPSGSNTKYVNMGIAFVSDSGSI